MGQQSPDGLERSVPLEEFLDLCRRLNNAGVQYMVYGGYACIMHGHVRVTEDVDLWLGENPYNIEKAVAALSSWGEGWIKEMTVDDLLNNVVVRIGDVLTLDLAAKVWKLDWNEAWTRRRIVEVEEVAISIVCRSDLIRSKDTYRERDHWDRQVLMSLSIPEPGRSASVRSPHD